MGGGLAGYYAQRLRWRSCHTNYQCASLRVPTDYSHPGGSVLSLALIRLPATGSRMGSLVLNPGGPGGSGVQFVLNAAADFPAPVRARFDIVSFDPRGVGESSPVSCLNGHELDEYVSADPEPSTPAQVASVVAASKMFAAGCLGRSGRALLSNVSTLDEARDMDVLRAALGDTLLTYLGFSYGTYLGAKYLQLFPDRIRAMVLDGAVDPSLGVDQLNLTQAEGFETDLNDFVGWCIAGGNCPLGTSRPAATAALTRLTASVQAHPVPGQGGRLLESGEFFNGLADALYSPAQGWPELEQALGDVQRGSGTLMLELSDQLTGRGPNGQYTNEIEANVAINCVDRPSPRTLSAYEAQARADERAAPLFGAPIVWGSLTCAYWPVPAAESPHPVRNRGPATVLVIGTTRDPATPYEWAQALTSELGNARLLTYQGDGHTAYLRGSSCVDGAVDTYLLGGTLPARGAVCPG